MAAAERTATRSATLGVAMMLRALQELDVTLEGSLYGALVVANKCAAARMNSQDFAMMLRAPAELDVTLEGSCVDYSWQPLTEQQPV
jgi:hypothetical protein